MTWLALVVRSGRGVGLALGVLAAVTVVEAVPDLVSACSYEDDPTVITQVAGVTYDALFEDPDDSPVVVPRNAGLITWRDWEPWVSFPYERLDAMDGLFRARPPLEPGTEVDLRVVAGDFLDESPPTAPVLRDAYLVVTGSDGGGCDAFDGDSCGDGPWVEVRVDLEEPATDDLTSPERISYAVFTARSAAKAETARQPDVRVMSRSADGVAVVVVPSRLHRRRDIWVTVMAIDQAGNTSPRTEPFLAHAAREGCSVGRR